MADADRPSWRQLERRRQRDLDFLSWVKTAELTALQEELPNHKPGSWQTIAILRRIKMKNDTV